MGRAEKMMNSKNNEDQSWKFWRLIGREDFIFSEDKSNYTNLEA